MDEDRDLPETLPERAFTESLETFFPTDDRAVLGLGDDGAILRRGDSDLVLCCDPVVGDRHFLATDPLHAVGQKAVARNLSDLAAMGARPEGLLVSVLLPEGTTDSARDELFRGLRDAAVASNSIVLGGDTGSTSGPLTVTVTAIGRVAGRVLTRTGASVGDEIWISGPVGGSGLRRGGGLPRHLRIDPRIALGLELSEHQSVRAVLDVSDGLALDLWTLCRASGVPGAEIDADSIPIHVDASDAAGGSGRSALEHALEDGEDHELLIAASPGADLADLGAYRLGVLTEDDGILLRQGDAPRERLRIRGYQHGGSAR